MGGKFLEERALIILCGLLPRMIKNSSILIVKRIHAFGQLRGLFYLILIGKILQTDPALFVSHNVLGHNQKLLQILPSQSSWTP